MYTFGCTKFLIANVFRTRRSPIYTFCHMRNGKADQKGNIASCNFQILSYYLLQYELARVSKPSKMFVPKMWNSQIFSMKFLMLKNYIITRLLTYHLNKEEIMKRLNWFFSKKYFTELSSLVCSLAMDLVSKLLPMPQLEGSHKTNQAWNFW